jgi:hypothetical protein
MGTRPFGGFQYVGRPRHLSLAGSPPRIRRCVNHRVDLVYSLFESIAGTYIAGDNFGSVRLDDVTSEDPNAVAASDKSGHQPLAQHSGSAGNKHSGHQPTTVSNTT